MEFLRVSKSQSVISTLLHVLFNLALAFAVFLVMYISEQVEVALLLVLVSKWRIFAVRARYWGANLLANLVDVTVGCSIVGLLYIATRIDTQIGTYAQIGLAAFYAIWLIIIKPLSSKRAMTLQAALSLLLGVWSIIALAHTLSAVPLLTELLLAVVSYGSARHLLSMYNEEHTTLLSMIFSLLITELGWIASHWAIGYTLHIADQLRLPQVAILALLLGLIAERFYVAVRTQQSIVRSEFIAPILFSVIAAFVLLVFFSSAVNV